MIISDFPPLLFSSAFLLGMHLKLTLEPTVFYQQYTWWGSCRGTYLWCALCLSTFGC